MKIVFFGDSITDCDRDRTDETSLGNGYVKVLADKLRPIYPDMDIELYNKGVSGNEVCDLLARVQRDVIDLNPDAVVMMIGINNVIHQYKNGKMLDLEQFRKDFEELLLKLKNTGMTVICLEPFL
ncbi:MAG: GDSL-type esterase/lipase family protein, partial [Candidatus Coproplasma sp.]